MRGFVPQPHNYADGGLVQGVKRLFGMDEERNARIAAYRAQAAQEKAAQQQQAAPAPAPAVAEYSGMTAAQRREKAAGLADGGMVRGPGSGTSDDVPDEVREGTYIMPADSTRAVGSENLRNFGARGFDPNWRPERPAPRNGARGFVPSGDKVPVNLSNGEYKLPPEQVHAVGVQALDQMKDATHKPVRGFVPQDHAAPEEPRQFFANGGVVDDEQKRQPGIFPNNSPDAGANVYGASNSAIGNAVGKAAGFVADAFPGTTAAIKGSAEDAKDAYQQGGLGAALGQSVRVAATPLIGLADDVASSAARVLNPAATALKTFVTGDTTPIGQDAPASASAPAAPKPAAPAAAAGAAPGAQNPTDQRLATGVQTAPPSTGTPTASTTAAPAVSTEANQVMPGVYQHGRGQYSDSSAGMGMPRGFTGQPSAQNLAAADALAARNAPVLGASAPRGFQPQTIAAPTVRHSGNDWQARKDLENARTSAMSITANGGRFDRNRGFSPERAAYELALRTDAAARGAENGMDMEALRQKGSLQREGMQQAGTLQREEIQQAGANQRSARGFDIDRARVAIDGRRADGESSVRGFQVRAAAQQEQLRNTLTDPAATPQQKAQAQAALLALNGKGDSWKAVALQGGTDAQGNKTESMLGAVNERTGEMKRMEGQGGAGGRAAPQEASQRQVGVTYSLPNGKMGQWTEKGWLLVG